MPDLPLETILDSITEGVFTVNLDLRITSFNRAAETITGVKREEAISQLCSDVFRSDVCEKDCALRKAIESDNAIVNKPVYIFRADGKRIPVRVCASVLKDSRGELSVLLELFRI